MFGCLKKETSPEKAIKQMRQVECALQDMIYKYEKLRRDARTEFQSETKKSKKLIHLKKMKMLDHYIRTCENRLAVCVHKQYALEQLEVTKMQVEAIRTSTSVFKRWSKYNPIQKIEDLQDSIEEQMQDLSDITGLLEQTPFELDEDELLAELNQMDIEEQIQEENDQIDHQLNNLPDPPTNNLHVKVPVMI
jgi:hypothetical protein